MKKSNVDLLFLFGAKGNGVERVGFWLISQILVGIPNHQKQIFNRAYPNTKSDN
ncbi:MAG: hypothetical protein KKE05_01895 [Nanoarchaeota archaeon]|nr:hypothetical protein [Nanoarchaeota archaeon]